MSISMNIDVPANFDSFDNYKKFTMEAQGAIDQIHFAIERKDNAAIARAMLHAINEHIHQMRNLYAPLVANYEIAMEVIHAFKQKGSAVKPDARSSAENDADGSGIPVSEKGDKS